MELEDAIGVLDRNHQCCKNSLIYELHERNRFSILHFWELYDSVIALAKDALVHGRSMETTRKITVVYQLILKYFIFHLNKNDEYRMKRRPANFYGYIERLDGALDAYFRGVFIDEKIYSLKRPL